MPTTKVTCIAYSEPNDEFTFKIEQSGIRAPADRVMTGLEIQEMEHDPIVSMKLEEIAIFCLFRQEQFTDPEQWVGQSFEL